MPSATPAADVYVALYRLFKQKAHISFEATAITARKKVTHLTSYGGETHGTVGDWTPPAVAPSPSPPSMPTYNYLGKPQSSRSAKLNVI